VKWGRKAHKGLKGHAQPEIAQMKTNVVDNYQILVSIINVSPFLGLIS
jgi:hypothetical protein